MGTRRRWRFTLPRRAHSLTGDVWCFGREMTCNNCKAEWSLYDPDSVALGADDGDGCKRMRFIKPCTGTRGGDDDDDVSESPPPPPPTVGAGVVDPVYRCLRTSSTVEGAGYHQHLSRCVSACAKSAGMEWLNLLRQNFDFCWAVRSLRRIGWYKGCYHCVACADRLHLLAHSLGVVAYMGGWQCTAVPSCNVNLILHDSHKNMTLPPRELHALRP